MKLACQEGLAPGSTFAQKLRNLEAYGFEGVELNGRALVADPNEVSLRKKALADSPVNASSICGGHGAEIVHPDPARRQQCIDGIKRLLDMCAELGAVGTILVPIFNSNDRVPDLSPYKTRAQLEHELLVELGAGVAHYGESVGAAILLEPLNRYESNSLKDIEDAADVCRQIDSPGMRVMADFFHMSIEQTDIPASIEAVGSFIAHVHLADNTRKEPGTGSTDFRAGFAALKTVGFGGYMALECGLSGPAEQALPKCVEYLKACLSG